MLTDKEEYDRIFIEVRDIMRRHYGLDGPTDEIMQVFLRVLNDHLKKPCQGGTIVKNIHLV